MTTWPAAWGAATAAGTMAEGTRTRSAWKADATETGTRPAGRRGSEEAGDPAWRVESGGRRAAVERRPAFRPLIILGAGRADDGKSLWSTHQGEPLARGRLNVS